MHVSDLTDSDEVYRLQQKLMQTADALGAMVGDLGRAKQVIEFASDMRKRALAKAMTPFLEEETLGAAEAKARASFNYGEEIAALSKQLREAETVKATWESTRVIWDSTRSLLAMMREMSTI